MVKFRTLLVAGAAAAVSAALTHRLAADNPVPAKYKDGVYEADAKGHKGPVKVKVEIADGKIKDVKILENKEDRPKTALTDIPKSIVEKQSADVDAVTGATRTSNGIKKAVEAALKKAAVKAVPSEPAVK